MAGPHPTIGSLGPGFPPGRVVNLAVKLPYALVLALPDFRPGRGNLLTPPLPSGVGQVSAPILQLSLLQRPVFLVNSRSSHFTAASFLRRPFLRTYGANLPSSLTRVISHA